ncbi:MAG: DNA repair protein [Ruminococcaceae bacterium]|nr:DNA repair protein [Oscillospiraceae bacterium]
MNEKQLKKLTRLQLLELLILQTEESERLQKQLDDLKLKKEVETIQISNLGSIAEASMQIANVFNATQQAADLYLEAAKKQADTIVAEAKAKAEEIIRKAAEEKA